MTIPHFSVTVVTVTYGGRRDLLMRMITGAGAQGVERIVVVDNGATWPVRSELSAEHGDFVDVVELGCNTGSAGGFSAGIRRAVELGTEYIWLLDDDNVPEPGCLDALMSAYERLRRKVSVDRLAVLAFRPEHQPDIAAGVPVRRAYPRRNSFRGFHVLDIPYKIWRRTPWGRPRLKGPLPELIDVPLAPYSGLLFHRDVVQAIGLPREDFVLYADDHEYSARITSRGGRIVLATRAALVDLESSWNVRRRVSSSFGVLLHQGSDFRVYYGMRNGTYLDAHCLQHDRLMFALNRWVYLAMLGVMALISRRVDRYHLVLEAVRNGLSGRLGVHPRFSL